VPTLAQAISGILPGGLLLEAGSHCSSCTRHLSRTNRGARRPPVPPPGSSTAPSVPAPLQKSVPVPLFYLSAVMCGWTCVAREESNCTCLALMHFPVDWKMIAKTQESNCPHRHDADTHQSTSNDGENTCAGNTMERWLRNEKKTRMGRKQNVHRAALGKPDDIWQGKGGWPK